MEDLPNADAILIMGSNMAECHPVGFRFVVQAKLKGAKVLHVDPRFTRTSALANIYAPLRSGSDIVFLGGLIRYVLEEEKYFREYVVNYTNAATLIHEDYQDAEDLGGLFSGFDRERGVYDPASWRYDAEPRKRPGSHPNFDPNDASTFGARSGQLTRPPTTDPSLQHPRCVFQILRRHFARYTPEMVERVCGTPRAKFLEVAETLCAASGPQKTAAVCYAVGWTQHTTGVQTIRAAAMLQLLLGNIGRPGGGILALRGHATIQGSTDVPTLFNILPGYLNTPSALKPHDTLADYIQNETSLTSYWVNFPRFIVSLLKAWFGDAATKENDYGFGWLPRNVGDHSHLPMFVAMSEGKLRGFMAIGQNPAVGGQNASFHRKALARLEWLVVRDLYETETATFWKDSPEVASGELKPEAIGTEVFLMPAAASTETDGTFTNTERLIQFHHRAADPPGDARSDLWFTVQLGLRLKNLYAESRAERDRPIRALTWDYIDPRENAGWKVADEPSAHRIMKEINGYRVADGVPVEGAEDLKADGTTACGVWLYSGLFAPTAKHPEGHNHADNRDGSSDWVPSGWAYSWPRNSRILYNRASADPLGRPWPKEARLARERGHEGFVYWDATSRRWTGIDVPHFPAGKAPGTNADPDGYGLACHDGASPFIMKADGKGWLFVPSGLLDGPLPTHYEPVESPVQNVLYPGQRQNPLAKMFRVAGNPYAAPGSDEYPCVLSTYRLTEHHVSGAMTRWVPWLAALQPELFLEISPEHAKEIGVANTDWVVVTTPRGTLRARALVSRRIRPFAIDGRTVHQVGLPWHWGYKGLVTGDVVNNLSALVGDPNTTIHEAKVFVCRVDRGR
jgi:formate dehydrogenase major subunit